MNIMFTLFLSSFLHALSPADVRLSEGCRDLLSRLLQRDPKERISFDEFFNHPWVDLEHMPSEHCMEKGIALVKEAVEQVLKISQGNCVINPSIFPTPPSNYRRTVSTRCDAPP